MGLIVTMDYATFYIIAQGLFHKNGIFQIIFGNTSLSFWLLKCFATSAITQI
jgi:hypothetical protein